MFKNKGIKSDSYDSKTLNFTKEYLTKNNIYRICYYQYYCTENINNITPNNKCIVIESSEEKVEPSSYKNEGDINLGSFNLKEGFYKSNITKVYHCNEDSIENKYCPKFYDNSCKENMDCLSQNCNSNICMNSKDFYIYICTNGFDIHTENEYDVTGNTKEIENSAKCKKMNLIIILSILMILQNVKEIIQLMDTV